MTVQHGFSLVAEQHIEELNTMAKRYRHVKTGTELLSMENDDENKVFGITFRTPPPDSTGLPHILEHAVLCGSRKYPVKEPFIELVKGSLKTFLNAITFSDKTCYPVASQNLKDFYNLVDVYLDAVFYPRITPEIFQQEGWHYELDNIEEPLAYKGIVFNEMKGAYSSPDSLLYRYSQQAVFPDGPYGHDAGGDPQVMPSLTYNQFKTFHENYYHPSNARIFFYGDDDPQERLGLLQAYLDDHEASRFDTSIPLQASFNEPQRIVHSFPAGEDPDSQKAMFNLNWLLPENDNPMRSFSLQVLSYILLGTPASPLYKALIDSGLGEDIVGGGVNGYLRQLTFSAGLKGIATSDADQVEQVILNTLTDLAEKGIDPGMTEAALNTVEFQLREQNFGSYPRGLVLMISALTTWLHDRDPIDALAFEEPLKELKSRIQANPQYFETLIKDYLLHNKHQIGVLLEPDPELDQKQAMLETTRLDQARKQMNEGDLQAVIDNVARLKELQETPDSPEALATIPRLRLDDLDKEIKSVPQTILEEQSTKIFYHDLFTNGIVYLDIGFNLHAVPQNLLPYVSLFSEALLEIGTEKEDFVQLTQRIGQRTGGIHPTTFVAVKEHRLQATTPEAEAWLFLRGKSTLDRMDDLLDIMREILLTVKLDNPERFMQMLLEEKAAEESGLVPSGHTVTAARLYAKFNEASWVSEQMGGVNYLFFLRDLVEQVKQDWPSVLAKLETLRQVLINQQIMICNATLDETNWLQFQSKLNNFIASMPASSTQLATWTPDYQTFSEGLTMPAQVNYVAKGGNLCHLGYTPHGSSAVITNYLRTTWLWDKIRVQGGAYGAFCRFDHDSGLFSFGSYRDPNLIETLQHYDQTSPFLRNLDLNDDEVTKSIIGAISNLDGYQLPDAKGYSAMIRHLIGYTDDLRQQYRDEVLSTTAADFKAFGEVLAQLNETGLVVVLGSSEAIEQANNKLNQILRVTKIL